MPSTRLARLIAAPAALMAVLGCEVGDRAAPVDTTTVGAVDPAPRPLPVTYASHRRIDVPVTFPVLDAFLADSAFVAHARARLALTDSQLDSVRSVAREETARLRETPDDEYDGTTWAARELATSRITNILGPDAATALMGLVRYYWSDAAPLGSDTIAGEPIDSALLLPGRIPTDTRIVVNAPAYRMDLFENGKLVKTYRIGIGYPEFPLPTGIRTASSIIFNPTWTPPDEPWVEGSREVEVGRTVAAGSKLNPLGIAKIPIGLPSLIHGGKTNAQLGGFASHGCVGLTDAQLRDLALELARVGGAQLTPAMIRQFGNNRKETREVALANSVPVELRYETIVLQDGALHILRDVYGYGTNTEERLAEVLTAHGSSVDQLTPAEREKVTAALAEMALDPAGKTPASAGSVDTSARAPATSGSVTRRVKGRKAVVIPVAALAGKGYPAPVTN